jgi:ubiquinone/menaquinone biosynthesis C-methylase UbiE
MSNPFDNEVVASGYEEWYASRGRRADRLEKQLLAELLAAFPNAASVLEVGCGTGHITRWLAERGFRVVGVDLSRVMLREAARRDGQRYVLGDALALPFDRASFDIVAMITTLEFVADQPQALDEAVRVARAGLLLGVLNRCSLLALKRKASARVPWNTARFVSPRELTRLVGDSVGERLSRLRWRTTLSPVPGFGSLRLPWGGFIGMLAQLRPMRNGMTA